MPDQTIVESGKALIDFGVVGAVLLLTMGALVFVTKRLFSVQDALLSAVQSHKDDAVRWASLSEVVKNQMESQADLMKMTLDVVHRDRGRP